MKRSRNACFAVARVPLAIGSAGFPVDSMVIEDGKKGKVHKKRVSVNFQVLTKGWEETAHTYTLCCRVG